MLSNDQFELFGELQKPEVAQKSREIRVTIEDNAIRTLLVIGQNLDPAQGHCRLPLRELGAKTGLLPQALRDAIRDLTRAGLITVTHRVGKKLLNTYCLTSKGLDALHDSRRSQAVNAAPAVEPKNAHILQAIDQLKKRRGEVQVAGRAIVLRVGGTA